MSEEGHPGRGRANSPGCVEGASRLEPRYFLRVARAHPRPLRTLCMSKSCYWIAICHVWRQGVLVGEQWGPCSSHQGNVPPKNWVSSAVRPLTAAWPEASAAPSRNFVRNERVDSPTVLPSSSRACRRSAT